MERDHDEEIYMKNQPRTSYEDLCADGKFRRCNQYQVNTCAKQRFFFLTNSWRIQKALDSYFEEHAKEVWENWMNLEMQTTLLNTYPPKSIAMTLKALREQLRANDQLHAVEEFAGPVPEIPIDD